MSMSTVAVLSAMTLLLILAIIHVPLGNWMYRMFTDEQDWAVERWIYRLVGVDPRAEQRWTAYAMSVVAFGVVSVIGLFALIMVQGWLPWGFGRSQDWHTALNTAVSFTTNTNWQSYSGESGAGYAVAMLGLTVQNFVSAATGIAVAGVMLRGLSRQSVSHLGNFWVDLTRACIRLLLPIAVVGALLLLGGGVIQNLNAPQTVEAITGGQQVIQGGPVASQEVIKLLGTNGGGFFNANSAHPFENPSGLTNLLQIVLILMIAFSLPWTFGRMVVDRRQGFVVLGAMATLWSIASAVIITFQGRNQDQLAGGAGRTGISARDCGQWPVCGIHDGNQHWCRQCHARQPGPHRGWYDDVPHDAWRGFARRSGHWPLWHVGVRRDCGFHLWVDGWPHA